MAKRVAYKGLWQDATSRLRRAQDRAERAEGELKRLRAVLADDGAKIVQLFTAGQPIELPPLTFECVAAFIESTAIPTPIDEFVPFGITNYTWRGEPIRRQGGARVSTV